MGILLRNWHLKLSAVLLATVLYTGLVFSGSLSESRTQVPVGTTGQPPGTVVLSGAPGTVQVLYRAPRDEAPDVVNGSFTASIDLSAYDMDRAPQAQRLRIEVVSSMGGVEIVGVDPETVVVELDRLDERTVPVEVVYGEVPDTLEIDDPTATPDEVLVRGAASLVSRVDRTVARVLIDESGIDVSRPTVALEAVDIEGQPVEGLDLEPQTVSVEIDVREVETNVTVPVRPDIEPGTPAAGFALEALSVEPSTVTLRGLFDALSGISEVLTEPLSVEGASSDQTFEATLILPDGVRLVDGGEPVVTVIAQIGPSVSGRTFVLGVVCEGAGENACLPRIGQVSVTVSGPAGILSTLGAEDLTPIVDVSGLGTGTHDVGLVVAGLPEGIELLQIDPDSVTVDVVAPATPTPEPTAAP